MAQPAILPPLAPDTRLADWVTEVSTPPEEDTRLRELYFDANSTTPPLENAVRAMHQVLRWGWGNASASHGVGKRARALLDAARLRVATLWGTSPHCIVFTSGATETANALLRDAQAVITAGEHACVASAPRATTVPLLADGTPDVGAWREALRAPGVTHAAAILVNNETGAISPWAALARAAADARVPLICDATQAIGKYPVVPAMLQCDYMFCSAHKFGGPVGVGILWIAPGASRVPLAHGGGQEWHLRAGTESVAQAVGAAVALDEVMRSMYRYPGNAIVAWRARADAMALLASRVPGVTFHGPARNTSYTTLSFALPPVVDSRQMLRELALEGYAFNVGSACSQGKRSRVLAAMGVPDDVERSSVRLSVLPRASAARRLSAVVQRIVDWYASQVTPT